MALLDASWSLLACDWQADSCLNLGHAQGAVLLSTAGSAEIFVIHALVSAQVALHIYHL